MEKNRNWDLEMAPVNEKIEKYFEKVIYPLLPNAQWGSTYCSGAYDSPYGSAEIGLSNNNGILKGSPYYYKGRYLRFIHYTSIKNLISILREQSLRLYSLLSMQDPLEVSHSLENIIQMHEFDLERMKGSIFSLSMCKYENEEKGLTLDQWRLYGNDGHGVGIVLSFPKRTQNHWHKQYLSKIYYGDRHLKPIHEFINRNEEFRSTEKFQIRNPIYNLLLPLTGFHKKHIYHTENEVRFLITEEMNYNGSYNSSVVQPDLGRGNSKTHFIPLELNRNRFEKRIHDLQFDKDMKKSVKEMYPEVRIEKIILGYHFKKSDIFDIGEVVEKLTKDFGYKIPIEITKMKKYF